MNATLKLCIIYLAIITWNKAGHADGYGFFILSFIGVAIFITQIYNFLLQKKIPFLYISPFFLLFIYGSVAWLNPQYRTITLEDLKDLNFEQVLLGSQDSTKIELVSRAINLTLSHSKKDPQTSLSIFFHYKNQYFDKFSNSNNDSISEFFIELEKKIALPFLKFLPSCTIKSENYFRKFLFFVFNLFIGMVLFSELKNIKQINFIINFIVINCLILSIVGFYQNINHQWTDEYIEILGLWNAPEPRYYFSTFTYKNHWSAFALMALWGLFYLFYKESDKVNKLGLNILKSKLIFYYLISGIIISTSILYSGSRSGCVMLFLSLFIYILKFNYFRDFIFNLKKVHITLLFLPMISLLLFIFSNEKKWEEMKKNTISQWENLIDGKPPLRFHFWKDSLEIIKAKPFWGYGYNSFASIYPKFQSKEVRMERDIGLQNAHTPYVPLVAHAHNDVLEYIIEWGIFGSFLIFVPLLFILLKFTRIYSFKDCSLLLFPCLTFLLYCFVDFPTRTPACLAMFSTSFALAIKANLLKAKFRM